ncbi:MAG: hypothetical protein OHK0039_03520 [Bacteroidia bacterium]
MEETAREIDTRIAAYLCGEASPAAEHWLRHWVDAGTAHGDRFEAMYQAWETICAEPALYSPDVEAGWRALLATWPEATQPAPPTYALKRRLAGWIALLAGLLLGAGGIWYGASFRGSDIGAGASWQRGGLRIETTPGSEARVQQRRWGGTSRLTLSGAAHLSMAGRRLYVLGWPQNVTCSAQSGTRLYLDIRTPGQWIATPTDGTVVCTVGKEVFVLRAGQSLRYDTAAASWFKIVAPHP